MNKKIVYAVFISALGLSLFAAGQKESYDAEKPEWSQQRTRIVNLSPPIYSMLLTFPYLADSVVGVNAVEGFADGAGQAAVSMEQIHAWNPDVIFINNMRIGKNVTAAEHILQNKVDGADWSFITAVKEKCVFDIPQGTYIWGMPCADSPLVPLWMLMKVYPDRYTETEFKEKVKRYYKEMYATDLPDAVISDMLQPIVIQ